MLLQDQGSSMPLSQVSLQYNILWVYTPYAAPGAGQHQTTKSGEFMNILWVYTPYASPGAGQHQASESRKFINLVSLYAVCCSRSRAAACHWVGERRTSCGSVRRKQLQEQEKNQTTESGEYINILWVCTPYAVDTKGCTILLYIEPVFRVQKYFLRNLIRGSVILNYISRRPLIKDLSWSRSESNRSFGWHRKKNMLSDRQ